jgi:hypothetical protein
MGQEFGKLRLVLLFSFVGETQRNYSGQKKLGLCRLLKWASKNDIFISAYNKNIINALQFDHNQSYYLEEIINSSN